MENPNEKIYEEVYNPYALLSDMSCSARSDRMSCDTMHKLAINEAKNNKLLQEYSTINPACEKYTKLADRLTEDVLQKGEGLTRMMCFKPEGVYTKDGEWVKQFNSSYPSPEIFLMSTKQRFRSKV
ncbi:MAG: hypothetical protein EBU66_20325 [Bacteroidetes bacterium]|nr:hypothetical protein [Bacteroidota bacterium]